MPPLKISLSGRAVSPVAAPASRLAAEVERRLRNAGAVNVSRDEGGIQFELLPLRQLMPSLFIEHGRFELPRQGEQRELDFSATVPLFPTLLHVGIVVAVMAGLAVHSGAPVFEVACVAALALLAFLFGVRAAAGATLRHLARRAFQAESSR